MGLPNGSEWIILVLIVVLLFGAKKLPEAARGLGRSLRIFKSEVTTKDPVPDETEVHGSSAMTPSAIAPPAQPPVQAYVPPVAAPGQVPTQAYVPVQPAPVAPPTQVAADPTSVQSVNERFYGEERSDR